ncbi:hypothetical protein [Halocalculus aciditolerans]|uniref:Uncharacterized protein n=1 Tax=Halocalculus aciditolerans TaxID=1383812 RepID=A0A830F718_9EURY|nr:hypothetical protein [Halocalculus aciditolerans]GGL69752.1 hypothetical protein GCM10009039_29680 [Halocalculus aciditolerans]
MSEEASEVRVDSRWWYWIGVLVVVTVVEIGLGVLLVGAVAATLVSQGQPPTGALVVAVPYLVFALAVRVIFPLAVFRDATAVRDADVEWSPEPWNWALVAVVGFFVPVFDTAVALYYLYRRHRAVGVP